MLEAVQLHPAAPLRQSVPNTRRDGLIKVRMAPLERTGDSFETGEAHSEADVDQQLIVDYTAALARRVSGDIRDGVVSRIDDPHQHPLEVACLRCAVHSASDHQTLASTLLEILTVSGADEEWNNLSSCTDTKMVSRLRRLAISTDTLAELYGPEWPAVMLTCLRIERTDFEMLDYLTRRFDAPRSLDVSTRIPHAAYHLATMCAPRHALTGELLSPTKRHGVAVRAAVAVAGVAMGNPPVWLDHLSAPAL